MSIIPIVNGVRMDGLVMPHAIDRVSISVLLEGTVWSLRLNRWSPIILGRLYLSSSLLYSVKILCFPVQSVKLIQIRGL